MQTVVAFDVSGSVPPDILKLWFLDAQKRDAALFITFDYKVIGVCRRIEEIKLHGGGGTFYDAPVKYVADEQAKGALGPTKLVIYTDGYAFRPVHSHDGEIEWVQDPALGCAGPKG